jgi:hypothetical protein
VLGIGCALLAGGCASSVNELLRQGRVADAGVALLYRYDRDIPAAERAQLRDALRRRTRVRIQAHALGRVELNELLDPLRHYELRRDRDPFPNEVYLLQLRVEAPEHEGYGVIAHVELVRGNVHLRETAGGALWHAAGEEPPISPTWREGEGPRSPIGGLGGLLELFRSPAESRDGEPSTASMLQDSTFAFLHRLSDECVASYRGPCERTVLLAETGNGDPRHHAEGVFRVIPLAREQPALTSTLVVRVGYYLPAGGIGAVFEDRIDLTLPHAASTTESINLLFREPQWLPLASR